MLRNSVLSKVYKAIEDSPFTVSDFDVDHRQGQNYLLKITFRHDPKFDFTVEEGHSQFSVTYSPGDHLITDSITVTHLGRLPELITSWTRSVREELRSALPVYSEIDELRAMMEKHVENNVNRPNEPFSETEAEQLRKKLDEMATRFSDMQQRAELTDQEVKRLNEEIASIKVNLKNYPKGVWYKTAANRMLSVFGTSASSQESREVIAEAAKKALGLDP